MGNTPESQIGKAETIEGGIIVPLSTQELHAKIKDVQEKKELSKKSVSTATPSDELGAFRQAEREKGATIEIRNDTVDILAKTPGVAANFGGNIEAYKTIVGDKRGDWRFAANTPELVTIVKNSTAIEKAALSTDPSIIIPEGYKSRGQPEMSLDARTEGNLREKKDGSFQDRFILRPEGKTSSKPETPPTPPSGSEITVNNFTPGQQATARAQWLRDNPQGPPLTIDLDELHGTAEFQAHVASEITVNNFTPEEQAAKKEEWLKNNPQSNPSAPLDIDLAQMERDATPVKNPEMLNEVDINLDTLEADALRRSSPVARAPGIVTPEVVRPVTRTPEKKQALERDFLRTSTESLKNIEHGMGRLEARKKGAMSRLLEMGVSAVPKGLDAWKKVDPKIKLALGVTLAGASLYSGGLTAIVGAGVMKAMSAASYGSAFYDKMLAAEQKKNPDVKKGWIAARALAYGVVTALATSALIGQIVEHVPGIYDSAVEKASDLKDSVTNWFSSFKDAAPVDFSQMPVNGLDLPADYFGNVPAADSLSPGESIVTPGLANLSNYTISPGDNITNVIREQIFPTIPGVESMSDLQKNNIIENLIKQAHENPGSSVYSTINQFANPNVIQPGDTLNLGQIREAIVTSHQNSFGTTLLDHARTITGGVATSAPTAGVIDAITSTATPAAPLQQVPPFFSLDGVPDAPVVAPPVTPEPYLTATSQAPTAAPASEVVLPPVPSLQHPVSVPQTPPDVLLDGSGNPVTDGSGNFIKTGVVSDGRQ